MTERIVDVSEVGAYLHVQDGRLLVESGGEVLGDVPLHHLAGVILTHPRVTISRGALAGLAEAGAVVVVCGENFLPVGMQLGLTGYHAPARRLAAQAQVGRPVCKRAWQQIVQSKIRNQAAVLRELRGDDGGLGALAGRVGSGDPQNVEAQAARRYWPLLFDRAEFRRKPEAPDENRMLNYGYAILRAMTARAICAAGLHPGLGVHHHHRNNAYCLADDLMEPLRPFVDRAVVELAGTFGADAPLDRDVKRELISAVYGRVELGGEQRTVLDALGRIAGSLAGLFEKRCVRLVLPSV